VLELNAAGMEQHIVAIKQLSAVRWSVRF